MAKLKCVKNKHNNSQLQMSKVDAKNRTGQDRREQDRIGDDRREVAQVTRKLVFSQTSKEKLH